MFKIQIRVTGFTLVELIVTISIAGILTAIAVPTFGIVISNNRLTAFSNEFVGALNLARSEAIKRGITVAVQSKSTPNALWRNGWDVFIDTNEDKVLADDGDAVKCETFPDGSASEDCLLRSYPPLPDGFTLIGNANTAKAISFGASGKSLNGTLILCDTSRGKPMDIKTAKVIIITTTGRIRMGVDGDNNGIPERHTGLNISACNSP